MKKTKLALLLLAILAFDGCAHNPSKVSASAAASLTEKLTYLKDAKTGICYATVASRQTGSTDQDSLTITYVPCTPEVEAQIAKK